jgi:hypothetical protein
MISPILSKTSDFYATIELQVFLLIKSSIQSQNCPTFFQSSLHKFDKFIALASGRVIAK